MAEPLIWTVRPAAQAVSDVRRRLRCECHGLSDAVLDDAMLLTSELVTNAIRHGRGEVTVRLWPGPPTIRLEVSDQNPRAPAMRDTDVEAEQGRGLAIVDALSDRWGSAPPPPPAGKTVWFELDDQASVPPVSQRPAR